MIKIHSTTSETESFRILEQGDTYGRSNKLTWDRHEPAIEFYKDDYFISRYYLSTFMEVENGLCLSGHERQFDLSTEDIRWIQDEVRR